jgi:hypothetical protein
MRQEADKEGRRTKKGKVGEMATLKTERPRWPQVDPIKKIQQDILDLLQQKPGEAFSSYQIADALRKPTAVYAIEDIQEALGYLADAGRVKFKEQRYFLPSSS